jgi:GDP-D-mannose dehydratase
MSQPGNMGFKNKTVLITGISGFVGSCLAKHLLNEGADVFGLDIDSNNTIAKGIEILKGNIQNISTIEAALNRSKPDIIFHLAAVSFVPESFKNPSETIKVNCLGTNNLLDAVRSKGLDPVIVFAGSSEEYGLTFISDAQYQNSLKKYGVIFPPPTKIPELPITEANPLRPMSPYAVSKVYGDYIMRTYHACYGMRTVVSRGFNQGGAGRGKMYVTTVVASQVIRLKRNEIKKISVGNVNAFRDWSHVKDIVKGYCLLAEKGKYGDVYNQGSQRTNSVLSYLLLSMECAGYIIDRITTVIGNKTIDNPTEPDNSAIFGLRFEKTKIDKLMLEGKVEFKLADIGIVVTTNKGKIFIEFDKEKFRAAEVPIWLSKITKIQELGFKINYDLKDIINDQLSDS